MFKVVFSLFSLFTMSYSQGKVSQEGGICGGLMVPNMIHTCAEPLECVYTKGPMIADAPGTCHPKCETKRDAWGNCIPKNCEVWNDGCNTCQFHNNKLACSENKCYDAKHAAKCEKYSTKSSDFFHCSKYLDELSRINQVCCAGERGGTCMNGFPEKCSTECSSIINLLFNDCNDLLQITGLDKQKGWDNFYEKCKKINGHSKTVIPKNCATWFDGCNRCSVRDGKVRFCTRRACLRMEDPACLNYHNNNHKRRETGRECFDGKDNDGDGLKDCEDSDCRIYGRCRHVGGHERGRMCFDKKDNDGDGLKDCDDDDCRRDPRLRRYCARHTETGRECFDGRDNDHDGKVDCKDENCQHDPRARLHCRNNIDQIN